ncbi:MAG: hypothetical protein EBR81_17865 [Proteobacteria bacterium]|nr:hypothetical protein [Pseudomonadota bacterium]
MDAGTVYVRGIRGARMRFSVALPRRLGEKTLALLKQTPPLESPVRLRVGRGTVFSCMTSSLFEANGFLNVSRNSPNAPVF